jgi:hypothetical protein
MSGTQELKNVMSLYRVFLAKRVKVKRCITIGNEVRIEVNIYDGNNNDDYTILGVELKPDYINVKWEVHMREWAHP